MLDLATRLLGSGFALCHSDELSRLGKKQDLTPKIAQDRSRLPKPVVSCYTESESGGRMIDAILTNTMLPDISREFLTRMMEGKAIEGVSVGVADGGFSYTFA